MDWIVLLNKNMLRLKLKTILILHEKSQPNFEFFTIGAKFINFVDKILLRVLSVRLFSVLSVWLEYFYILENLCVLV
jgi:hypothetical protein